MGLSGGKKAGIADGTLLGSSVWSHNAQCCLDWNNVDGECEVGAVVKGYTAMKMVDEVGDVVKGAHRLDRR